MNYNKFRSKPGTQVNLAKRDPADNSAVPAGVERAEGERVHSRVAGPLAQLVEQQTLNLRVRGSIPWRLTIFPPRNHTLPHRTQEDSLRKWRNWYTR